MLGPGRIVAQMIGENLGLRGMQGYGKKKQK